MGGVVWREGKGGEGGGGEEGNSLKKHYVTKECMHGSVLKGPRLWRGERGFCWSRSGRLAG